MLLISVWHTVKMDAFTVNALHRTLASANQTTHYQELIVTFVNQYVIRLVFTEHAFHQIYVYAKTDFAKRIIRMCVNHTVPRNVFMVNALIWKHVDVIDPGYTLSSLSPYECVPDCIPPCTNAICSDINQCICLPGYRPFEDVPNICEAICDEPCLNGYCIKPNQCQCNAGFMNIDNSTCAPLCIPECINGECTAPDKCTCLAGYEAIEDSNICVSPCSDDCVHGYCSNGTCVCDDEWFGYDCNATEIQNSTELSGFRRM